MRASAAALGLLLLALLASGAGGPSRAATLRVGPARALRLPSDAALRARDGDTIAIDAGEYVDCAVWTASGLLIRAEGGPVVVRDRVCDDKAIFVTAGADITIRDVTLAGARSASHNGAGIRAEGGNLTVERTRFVDDEDGILTRNGANDAIVVRDSEFRDNGSCAAACAHGIYAGHIASLLVERCRFVGTLQGHHVKSRARATVIVDSVFSEGAAGHASYLIDVPNGGSVLIAGNRMEKGPRSDNPETAISIGAEGVTNPTLSLVVRDNVFGNRQPGETVFVRNLTASTARLSGNVLHGPVVALAGPGTVAR